jgi:hypothetical protein
MLYMCDELDTVTRTSFEAHTAQCSECASVFSRQSRMHQAIVSLEQPADSLDRSGLLLAQCRSQLLEAIDDHHAKLHQPGWLSIFSPAAWWSVLRNTLVYHPALTMASLVVVSFMAGVAGQRMQVAQTPVAAHPVITASAKPPAATAVTPTLTPSVTPKLTDQQLYSAASANVAWVTPSSSPTPTVQVQLMSETPTSIIGAPADADVERALMFVLENGQRFGPDARLESLDVLRTCAADPEVRRSLCTAARADQDPGLRRKALETLQGFEQDRAVRQTILDALQNDSNSGVRVQAMNLLINILQAESPSVPPDPQIIAVLRGRLRNDPNNYIRLQSAAALRGLGAGERP